MGKKLAALDAGLTGRVILVKTTGLEEAGAAYTRGAAIILKQSALQADDDALERLLLHELFHVVSRSAPGLRRELYAVIGFAPANEIDLPASLAGRKITNPDAPRIDCRIEVLADGRRVSATPVLYSREAAYDPATSGGLLAAMEFKLLVLEETGGQWVAASREGKPWLLDPEKTPSFHEKIGANTGYVIHPEEILAENFVLLATGTRNLRTPRVVEGLHRVLRSRRRL
jgi:hypothetical protein